MRPGPGHLRTPSVASRLDVLWIFCGLAAGGNYHLTPRHLSGMLAFISDELLISLLDIT